MSNQTLTADELDEAQKKFQFYETNSCHSKFIYKKCNTQKKLKVIDICCGLGSLIDIWYKNHHDVTIIELNEKFIPILKRKYPKAKIITGDFLLMSINETYDVYLCNPPFKNKNETIYPYFFCKIASIMKRNSVLFFICPRMFYTNQEEIKIEHDTEQYKMDYINTYNRNPPIYFFKCYGFIDLQPLNFRFNKQMIKRMIDKNIVPEKFITSDEVDGKCYFSLNDSFEYKFLGNINDFKTTKILCGLFQVSL